MIGLTKLEGRVLAALETLTVDGVGPSLEEVMAATGLGSRSGVHRVVVNLEGKGRVRRAPGRARAIEIVKPTKLDGIDIESLSQTELLALSFAIDARLDDLQAAA